MDNGKEQKFDLDELNLDTDDMSWDYSPTRNVRSMQEMGNKAISSPGETTTEASTETGPKEITPAMPPGYLDPENQPENSLPEANVAATLDSEAIKTTDKLDARAIKIIDDAIDKFNQDGDIASFNDTARSMMETNLENSYNRKLSS